MNEKGLKIVTIGGGSSYTPEIIEGFINQKLSGKLPIRELYLVDIEEGKEKLEIVGNLAKRMVAKANADIQIHLTLDRRSALKDADFVTTQFRVGLLDARIRDERIPLKYGLIGQETNGAGGFMKAMRTIPVILDICKDMRELCPDAWLINFTNPSGIITETVLKHGGVKCIGLCNVPLGLAFAVARIFEVDIERVYVQFEGLNHYVFTRKVYIDGIDRTKELTQRLLSGYGESNVANIPKLCFPKELLEAIDLMPADYLKYYFNREKMLAKCKEDAANNSTRGEVVKKVEAELFELYKDETLAVKPDQLTQRGGAHYSEAAVNLITSIYNNDGKIHYVNVQNNGTLSELPDDVAIECNCVVNRWGATPLQIGRLTTGLRGRISLMKAYEELTVDAGVHGNYLAAIEALAMNPLVNDGDLAAEVLNDMLIANKAYLPQFQQKIHELENNQ